MRQGTLFLRGRPKTPTWTRLNATTQPGDTEITVEGEVNWEIGDQGLGLMRAYGLIGVWGLGFRV